MVDRSNRRETLGPGRAAARRCHVHRFRLEGGVHSLVASGGDVHSSVSAVADKKGNVFVAAGTREGLKVTDDAFRKNYRGHVDVTGGDIFLMKLSPVGESIYSTYIGGSGSENHLEQIVLDDSGNVYVGFTAYSTHRDHSVHGIVNAQSTTS